MRLLRRLAAARPTWFAVFVLAAFAFQPFLAFLDHNRLEVTDWGRPVEYALWLLAAALVATIGLRLARPTLSPDRVACGVAAAIFAFFTYATFDRAFAHAGATKVLFVWAIFAGCLTALVALWSRNAHFRTFVLVAGLLMAGAPGLGFTGHRLSQAEPADPEPVPIAAQSALPADRPNVYFFLVDGYARQDQLERVLGFDNSRFVDELRSRGFGSTSQARANYPLSILSITSMLEMRYVATNDEELDGFWPSIADSIQGNNATVRAFRGMGYRYVHADSGWWLSTCDPDLADVCVEPQHKPSLGPFPFGDLEQNLLALTPVEDALRLVGRDLDTQPFTTPTHIAEQVTEVAAHGEPVFLFAHVISPHFPYVLSADCSVRSPISPFWDLPDQYLEQLTCLNRQLLTAVDRILAADPDAAIVIQSDHGSSFEMMGGGELTDPGALTERFAVFRTQRLPAGCPPPPEDDSNVNTFRTLLACIRHKDLEPLPERRFLMWYDDETSLEEVDPGPLPRDSDPS